MSHLNSHDQDLSSRYPPEKPLLKGIWGKVLKNSIIIFPHSKKNEGFTLIELLVVMIIVGVLGAILFPQVMQIIGKSREAEARSLMGAMNRTQQAFFNERRTFAQSADELEVPVGNEKYYTIFVNATNSFTLGGLQGAKGIDNPRSGTRDYAAAVGYDPIDRTYTSVICRSIDQNNNYVITGLRSIDKIQGSGRVAGAEGKTRARCVQGAGVETLEELR